VLDGVHHLQEGRTSDSAARAGSLAGSVGLRQRHLHTCCSARAALRLLASSLLTLQLALGLLAVGGFDTLVEAGEFLAHRLALGFGGFAGGVAVGGFADRFALGASFLLALVLGTADGADGFLTVNSALGAGGFLTLHLALGTLANRMAHSRAGGVITLPLALRVALFCRSSSNQENNDDGKENAGHGVV